MIYAIRTRHGQKMLVEFISKKEYFLEVESATVKGVTTYRQIDAATARQMVARNEPHETGLYMVDGKIRYARPEYF